MNRELLILDVWENANKRVKVAPARGPQGKVPLLRIRKFEWLEGAHGTQTTTLCGRNAVQVSIAREPAGFQYLAGVLKQTGTVSYNKFLFKFNLVENGDRFEFTVFPDGPRDHQGTVSPRGPHSLCEVRRALSGMMERVCYFASCSRDLPR